MPCYYTGSAEGDARLAAEESAERLTDKLTEVTRVACRALAVVEVYGHLDKLNTESRDWWTAHQELDERRRAMEKLTDREKELLGVR